MAWRELVARLVGIFQINAQVAMDAGVAVDAEKESIIGNFIQHGFAELNDVFLKRLFTGRVVQHFTDGSGIAGAKHILRRHSNEIPNVEPGH